MDAIIALSGFEMWQGVELALVLLIAALIIISLLKLRKLALSDTTKALWVLIILLIPIFGPLAFLIVKPGNSVTQNQTTH